MRIARAINSRERIKATKAGAVMAEITVEVAAGRSWRAITRGSIGSARAQRRRTRSPSSQSHRSLIGKE